MEKQYKYSLHWAKGVYQELYNRYGRALTTFNQIWHIPDETPPEWLAKGSPRWLNYKKLIRIWHNWEISAPGGWEDENLLHNRIVLLKFMIREWRKWGNLW